jgi:hypothetical protein
MAGKYSTSQVSEALEAKLAALRLSATCKAEGFESTKGRAQFGFYERTMLKGAETYHWASQIAIAVVESSRTLPGDTALDLSKFRHGRAGWFWFERPLSVGTMEPFSGMLWVVIADPGTPRTLFATTYVVRSRGPEATDTIMVKELVPLDHEEDTAEIHKSRIVAADTFGTIGIQGRDPLPMKAFIISALLWIEQKIVVESIERANRSLRRRLERESVDVLSDQIKVIRLRRPEHEGECDQRGLVEWSCQWVVRGHWRQQFYPSTGERRPLFILPYVKGPDDKPLKAPSATVFSVSR